MRSAIRDLRSAISAKSTTSVATTTTTATMSSFVNAFDQLRVVVVAVFVVEAIDYRKVLNKKLLERAQRTASKSNTNIAPSSSWSRSKRSRRRRRWRWRREQKRGKKCLNICKRNRWKKKTFGNAVAINQSRVNESAIKTGCLRGGGKVERRGGGTVAGHASSRGIFGAALSAGN